MRVSKSHRSGGNRRWSLVIEHCSMATRACVCGSARTTEAGPKTKCWSEVSSSRRRINEMDTDTDINSTAIQGSMGKALMMTSHFIVDMAVMLSSEPNKFQFI